MAITINNPVGGGALSNRYTATAASSNTHQLCNFHHQRQFLLSSLSVSSRIASSTLIVAATGKFSSRTGKFDSRNKRGSNTTTTNDEDKNVMLTNIEDSDVVIEEGEGEGEGVDDGYFLPDLPGLKPDFWEGPQWDSLGFFVQYLWAFGIVFALIACGIAVATYNEGATDFRETPAFKSSIQSQDLLEGPEASDTDVFESNPTEEAPALE